MLKSTRPLLQAVAKRVATNGRVKRPRPASSVPVEPISSPSLAVEPIAHPVYVTLTTPFHRKPAERSFGSHAVALDPTVFNHPIRRDVLHLCVVHYRDSLRQGSANTKTRGEVAGSGRKIRPQKGSGKARLGDAQSPMLRGGGVAFGPKPRDFSTKLPRKVIQMGMRVALSAKVQENRIGVMMHMDWPNGKTKHLSQRINALGLKQTLFVTGEEKVPTGLQRAIQNIPLVSLITADKVNIYELLKWPRIMLDSKAVEFFERTLGKPRTAALLPDPSVDIEDTANVA